MCTYKQELVANRQHHIDIHIKIQPTTKRITLFQKNCHLPYGIYASKFQMTELSIIIGLCTKLHNTLDHE